MFNQFIKIAFIFALLVLAPTGFATTEVVRLSEPVAQDEASETFGAVIDTSLPTLALNELMTKPQEHLGETVLLNTPIAKVCQKKGCFFITTYQDAQLIEQTIRVAFKDYGFFIPSNAGGKTVLMAARLVEKELSPEQAAHFSQDLNNEKQLQAGKQYELVASAVKIPLS